MLFTVARNITGKLFSEAPFYCKYSIFGQSGLRSGATLGVISDIHRVRINPEIPESGTNTKKSKKWNISCIKNNPSEKKFSCTNSKKRSCIGRVYLYPQ